jgi:hypothetical protein
MSQLSSIIYQEILSIENIKTTTYFKIPPKNSKLLTLAEDVKNIMNNYIFIQSKVSDMREIIDNFDEHIELPDESISSDPLFTSAYHFLSAIPPNQVMTNNEIEEISNELWSKQLEVETMLKIEVKKLRQFQDSIENRYFYKNDFLKTKAGLKIRALEMEKVKIREEFLQEINGIQMFYEEIISLENEKNLNEEKRINKLFDPYSIKDLPEAIAKIKELLGIKLIYEKKRTKDEKLIKGLNTKLQLLIDSYSDLSEKHEKLEENFEELKKNHEILVESSNLLSPKNKDRPRISKQESLKFDPIRPEVIFAEFPLKKSENLIDVKVLNKPRNESIRISRAESRTEKSRRSSPRKKLRTATPAGRSNFPAFQQLQKTQERQENAIKEFKQALFVIDENFKKTNKALTENLEELVGSNLDIEIQNESKNLAGRGGFENRQFWPVSSQGHQVVNGKISVEIPGVLLSNSTKSLELEEQKGTELKSTQEKETQMQQIQANQSVQTSSKLFSTLLSLFKSHKTNQKLSGKSENDLDLLISQVFLTFLTETKDSSSQCEKESVEPIELKMSSNELIKGLLNRKTRGTYFKAESEVKEDSIIEKIIKIPVFSGQKIEEIKENQINQLVLATQEYKKEFVIQTQLRGFKKLELENIQTLWGDIINRRISDGEQDKISVYLRGLLGTANFEKEKQSVIEMIESSKLQNFSNQSKVKKNHEKVMKNWVKIMTALFCSKLSVFTETLSTVESPTEKLFEVAKKIKFVRHRLVRTAKTPTRKHEVDMFGFDKSDKWIVRSITPTLVETARVKSRYLNSRRINTTDKFRRPVVKMTQYREIVRSPTRY